MVQSYFGLMAYTSLIFVFGFHGSSVLRKIFISGVEFFVYWYGVYRVLLVLHSYENMLYCLIYVNGLIFFSCGFSSF
uniref:Uncharacterized protein n=1 Tax=Rhizophora mucronata TaxID=61149 RepID=A0A2P2PS15_RHIMU